MPLTPHPRPGDRLNAQINGRHYWFTVHSVGPLTVEGELWSPSAERGIVRVQRDVIARFFDLCDSYAEAMIS